MTPHLVWAGVVLVIAALVVIERRRGRVSDDVARSLDGRIGAAETLMMHRTNKLSERAELAESAVATLRKDVESLKAERQREGLQKLRGG